MRKNFEVSSSDRQTEIPFENTPSLGCNSAPFQFYGTCCGYITLFIRMKTPARDAGAPGRRIIGPLNEGKLVTLRCLNRHP